ncbi:MAG: hypothetical protein HQL22_06955 [Candidatus Omnitrophica bacterium]|nr:hypothetical protein [Candidatus Omnitrophota bacterium]
MNKIEEVVKKYLLTNLGIEVVVNPFPDVANYPAYLREGYRFFTMKWFHGAWLLMIGEKDVALTPAVIAKQLEQVRERCSMDIVYVADAIGFYDRKRLIEHKVPFIVPGNQMYLPFLAIDLREYIKTLRIKRPTLRPATQMLVLYELYQSDKWKFTPLEVASLLDVSAMTMTRAFDELAALGIGEHTVAGKNRCLHFAENRKELWEKVQPYLKSPVKKRVYITDLHFKKAVPAGNTALARWSMINEPETMTVAVSQDDWKYLAEEYRRNIIPAPDRGAVEVEIWKYAPDRFSQDGYADKISVYLSLKNNHDERVQSALEELLRGFKW